MSGTIWTKFYWADWQSDPALRLCSYASRGLWMDLLCIAAAHDPIGYVAVAGRGLSETDIARMTGGSESEVHALLGDLERNGVFSRDRKGTIYSRRMVMDAKKVAIAKKNGKNGGNPNLSKQRVISTSDNPKVKGRDNPHIPEAINQEPEDTSSLRSEDVAPQASPPALFSDISSRSKPSKKQTFAVPSWIPPDAWAGFVEMRKRIKAPLTDRAMTGIVNELEKLKLAGHEPGAVLDQSTERCWRGVFELKGSNNNGYAGHNNGSRMPTAHDNFAIGAALAGGLVPGRYEGASQSGDDAGVTLEFGQPRNRAA